MVCVYCKSATEIVNTRQLARNNTTWRRRRCLKCGSLITTFEEPNYTQLWVVIDDRSGKLSPFIRERLFLSLYDSLRHRRTAVTDASGLTATTMAKVAKSCSDGRIERKNLIDIALACLKRFDKAASVYYQAYYSK